LVWERLGCFLPCEELLDSDPVSVSSSPCGVSPASPEEEIVAHEALQQVQQALASLNTKHRQIIELRYYRDLSYREIADALGITPSNAGVRLARALAHLKPRLVGLMEPPSAVHKRTPSAPPLGIIKDVINPTSSPS
jgi:DNA-directed RNA polymerase specialized sigma24 family protein